MRDTLLFIRNYLASPGTLGSVAPSSRHLVKAMLDGIDFQSARVVVEYGPGTGVFTDEILKRLAPDARFLCIELMDDFYQTLVQRYQDPRMVLVQGSAADVESLLAEHGLDLPDAIVSGLPFTSLPDEVRHAILRATVKVLKPAGRMVLYQYSQLMTGQIKRYFGAARSRFVLLNFPPAYALWFDGPRRELADAPMDPVKA